MLRWLALVACLWPALVAAQSYPDYRRLTVNDRAEMLSPEVEAALDAQLGALRRETGIEMTVLTLVSQGDHAPGMTIEQFATGLFDHWGIGDAARNDGILVLVIRDDRVMRIELGAGYGRDWDRHAARVVNRSFLPHFEAGDFEEGLLAGVDDTIETIARPFHAGTPAPRDPPMGIFLALAFLGAALLMGRRWIGDRLVRLRRCPNCQRRGLRRERRTVRKPTRDISGEGRLTTRCAFCNYRRSDPFTIAQLSSSSGGRFGGGRSGGGGATGRW